MKALGSPATSSLARRIAPCMPSASGVRVNLGSQGPHDDHFFLREVFRNEQLYLVAAIHSDQRQADAGIPGRGFDDRPAGRELAVLLGPADDSDGGAIFHAAAGIQIFEFGEDLGRTRREPAASIAAWECRRPDAVMSSATRR